MHHYRKSYRLLHVESLLSAMVFAMPVLNIFYAEESGMSLAQVGASQAAFTVALFVLNVPAGWLADKFSRKACNAFGDLLAAIGFGLYALSTEFWHVIACEIVIGIGLAFSGGADTALLKAYCDSMCRSYEATWARLSAMRPLAEIFAVLVGGVIGGINVRLAIAMSSVTYLIGAVLSLFVREAGERRVNTVHPLRDMLRIGTFALRGHKPLAWSIAAFAVGREATHAAVWLLTPLLLMAGVPAAVLGAAWALNLCAVAAGAYCARHFAVGMSDAMRFGIGMGVAVSAGLLLGLHVSLATIGLYALFGLARGWMQATLQPMVQRHTPGDIQSTVLSVAGSVSQLLYAPLVWGVGALGDAGLQTALLGNAALFAALALPIAYQLHKMRGA